MLLLLDPRRSTFAAVQDAGELPLQTFESTDGEKLVRCDYELETSDAERIALGDANRTAVPAGASGAGETRGDARGSDPALQADDEEHSRVLTALLAERSAVHMLHDRLGTACRYVERVRAGELPRDHETLRMLAAAVANQGAAPPPAFEQLLDEVRPAHAPAALTAAPRQRPAEGVPGRGHKRHTLGRRGTSARASRAAHRSSRISRRSPRQRHAPRGRGCSRVGSATWPPRGPCRWARRAWRAATATTDRHGGRDRVRGAGARRRPAA